MKEEEVYKNRDFMLGEIFENSKNTKQALIDIEKARKTHEKDDKDRFLWTWLAILVVAASAGVIPQLTAFALEHFK